ncbi:glycoside hydrolase family 130 protein [Nibricoccus sp. IMCC34717]|uniref:glycoside hydrolase family 130 protein n=1 Tax=Nibricoccus sp. IMCC34717 TaxID=3034021 RepID=UPI0038505D2B
MSQHSPFPEKRVFSKWRAVRRYAKNPIITADMVPFACRGIFNSSVVKHDDRYVMILRCEGYNFYNFFCLAESPNGYDNWKIGEVIKMPDDPEYRKYSRVQYDPRITKLGDTYHITFCCHSHEARMGHMSTKDFSTFKWEGFITGTGFRNTVFFPEKINGLYTALERPNALGEIWITQSPDMKFWGNQRLLMGKEKCSFGWGKIGPCGTPIKTKEGWLIIFHAVSVVCDYEYLYHAGVALSRLDDPSELIRVGDECILTPEMPYENAGHTPNCVFASSQVVEPDGSIKLYYGASDRYQCVADTSIDELLEVALRR